MNFFYNLNLKWHQPQKLEPVSFLCGYCGIKVSSEKGLKIIESSYNGKQKGGVYICPNCNGPVFFTPKGDIFPRPILGNDVKKVPDSLSELYNEARKCTGEGCYTASVLLCRKILMNIAVNQGAEEGKRFIEYVLYLEEKGFIPPNGKKWVDHIRKKGNEANHEIKLMNQKDAKELLIFIEMLLKFIYEFPSMID